MNQSNESLRALYAKPARHDDSRWQAGVTFLRRLHDFPLLRELQKRMISTIPYSVAPL
jgi:hypothetical protein